MSNYLLSTDTKVSIPRVLNEESITFYAIHVQVDSVSWEVHRRYSDFAALHDKLMEEGVDRDVLPPKKLLGNKEPSFLMKRRAELEIYLQNIFHFFKRNLPTPLADFLDFHKYDIHFILRNLADQFYQRELDLSTNSLSLSEDQPDSDTLRPHTATWTPLEMYSVSQSLQHTCPPTDPESKRYDFTNVVDTCCQLDTLELQGNSQNIGTSNLILNHLKFDFLAFKSLARLRVRNIRFKEEYISALGLLRSTLKELTVHDCGVLSVADVLLSDNCEDMVLPPTPSLIWSSLELLDLSENNLEGIDPSLRLAPNLETLILDNNSISNLDHLTGLPRLRRLSLAKNKLSLVQDLHTLLGQVTHIDLSCNKISTLKPFRKLYSLQDLNVSRNKVNELEEVHPVCSLPCLETLDLAENSVNHQVDYRLKVLEAMGSRCREVILDGSRASQSELDKVSVLMALRVTREKKSPTSLFGNLPSAEQWKT